MTTAPELLPEQRRRLDRARRHEHLATVATIAMFFLFLAASLAASFEWLPGAWWLWPGTSALALTGATLVRVRATRRRRAAQYVAEWLERAAARLDDRFDFGQDDGADYLDEEHPFARDLDVFGPGSLFQRLNATHTVLGRDALADRLRQRSALASLAERQALVQELRDAHELRQDLEVAWRFLRDRNPRDPRELERLERATRDLLEPAPAWLAEEPPPFLAIVKWLGTALGSLSVLAVALLGWPFTIVLAVWTIQLGVLAAAWGSVGRRMLRFESLRATFEAWSELSKLLEAWRPASSLARATLAPLHEGHQTASAAIRQLRARADRLSWRRNAFFAFTVDVLWLWDLHAWTALARWWQENGARVGSIFAAAAALEAEVALATYAAGVPDHAYPEPAVEPRLAAEALAHPLLPRATRVANDLELSGAGELGLITGSNMSGKSTFLRAAGLAAVMGRLGLPVAASRCRLHPELAVVTCMRVEDSLQRGASRFFAEATRLVECVHRLDEAPITLVLFDEILAGTNSRERHEATRALLDTLTGRPALTLVATHDLELAELAAAHPGKVWVAHFRDEARGDEMIFDYRLRPGVLPTTNAIRVLRALGLPGLPQSPEH